MVPDSRRAWFPRTSRTRAPGPSADAMDRVVDPQLETGRDARKLYSPVASSASPPCQVTCGGQRDRCAARRDRVRAEPRSALSGAPSAP